MNTDSTLYDAESRSAAVSAENSLELGRNFLILIVDDNQSVREVIRAMLEAQGYRVTAAAAPDEALNIFSRYRNDIGIIITDIILPGMNGWELAFELKRLKPGIPVLFCSGYNGDTVRIDCNDRYIAKPFEMAELKGIIYSMIYDILCNFRKIPVI